MWTWVQYYYSGNWYSTIDQIDLSDDSVNPLTLPINWYDIHPNGPILSTGTTLVFQYQETNTAKNQDSNGFGEISKTGGVTEPLILYGDESDLDVAAPHILSPAFDSDGTNVYMMSPDRLHKINHSEPELWERYGGVPLSTEGNLCDCHPLNLPLGDLTKSFTDLTVPGRGPGLAVTRSYDSAQVTKSGAFGYGWRAGYSMSLRSGIGPAASLAAQQSPVIIVKEEAGSELFFRRQSDGSYTVAPNVMATLAYSAVEGTWTFTRRRVATYVFDDTGQLQSISDLSGNTTTVNHLSSGDLSTVAADGRSLTFSYDSNHRITGIADTSGRSVGYAYDTAGNLRTVTDIRAKVWTYGYDTNHRLTSITDPIGHSSTATYDGTSWRVASQTDADNHTTTFHYATDPADLNADVTITSAAGRTTRQQYTSANLTTVTRPASGGSGASVTHYSYDSATRLLTEMTDPNGQHWHYTVDSAGDRLSATDPLGHGTSATYNSLNEPLTVTDANGVTTTNVYDSIGKLLSSSTPTGVGSAVRAITYHHDSPSHPGDVTSVTDPRGKTTSYTYDTYGQLTAQTDPLGNKTTYSYSCSPAGPGCRSNIGLIYATVNPKGNVTGATPADFTTSYQYDDAGNATQVTDPMGHVSAAGYDDDGRRVATADPNSHASTYTFDPAGG